METNKNKTQDFIRDAIHKNIDISEPVIQELVACKEFQRLRWISQLGGAQIAFPSATHTRFTHSLGVYHILSRVLNQVAGNETIAPADKLLVKITGLLHDIGHGPFSHTFEKITNFNEDKNFKFHHEWYTCAIITDPTTEINQVLRKYHIDIQKIINIISKDHQKCPKYQIQLVSSQLDCDRIDYLIRDGYFTGVDYGAIDLEWVVSNMIIDQKRGIVFSFKAVAAIENYLITRFHMYSQVYYHKSSIFFDINLQALFRYLKQLNDQNYNWIIDIQPFIVILQSKAIAINEYLKLNDATILDLLNNIIQLEQDQHLVTLAMNILFAKNQWKLKFIPFSTQNKVVPQDNIKVLKNIIYNLQQEPIIIKVSATEFLPLDQVSQILKNPTNEQVITYSWEN